MDIDSSFLPRARRSTRTLSPLRFCLYFFALLGLGLFLYPLILVLRNLYLVLSRIHFDAHHPTVLKAGWGWGENERNASGGEHEMVRPFFGKKEGGGVDKMDLVANLWYRPSAASINKEGITGSEEGKKITRDEWQHVFEKVVFRDLSPGQKKKERAKVEVMIKKEIMLDVRDGLHGPIPADLIATYVLIPSQSYMSPLPPPLVAWDYTHFFNPTHDLPAWPMITSLSDSTSESPSSFVEAQFGLPRAPALTRYLENHQTTGESDNLGEIVEMLHMATVEEKLLLRPMLLGPRNESTRWEKPRLRTRSWITMARDEPVYDVEVFKKIMRNLDWQQKSCMGMEKSNVHRLAAPEAGCDRNVGSMGHITGLLEVRNASRASESAAMAEERFRGESDESAQSQWRYPPYTTTALNLVHLSDYTDLPSEDEVLEDTSETFSFEWNVGFSTSSTLKLRLPIPAINELMQPPALHNITEHQLATHKDAADWWHAILGNHHDPHNRPILRSVFYFLGGLLQFISGLNDIHYYITRSLATGISLLPPLVYFGSCLFFDLTKNGWADPGFWFASGFNIVHLAPAAKLALRLEWQWGSRRWNRWIPIGVRRRKPTHSERASARRDWEFGWRERLGFFIAVFATLQVGSDPHIISASPPSAPRPKYISISPYTTYLSGFASTFLAAARWSELSQLILNHKSKTFGGHHPSGAYLSFVGRLCQILPIIMHSIWGKDQMMRPFSLFSALFLAGLAWMAWQAWAYKTVPQEDSEDE